MTSIGHSIDTTQSHLSCGMVPPAQTLDHLCPFFETDYTSFPEIIFYPGSSLRGGKMFCCTFTDTDASRTFLL